MKRRREQVTQDNAPVVPEAENTILFFVRADNYALPAVVDSPGTEKSVPATTELFGMDDRRGCRPRIGL